MQHDMKLWIRPLALVGLLSTISINNVMADDLQTAATAVFGKLKLPPQGPVPSGALQAPIPSNPVVPQSSPSAALQALTPTDPSGPVMPQSPASLALQALTPMSPPPPPMPEPPAAPALEQDATSPRTVTLDADGSGIPPDSLGSLAGTGDGGTDNGSADGV